MMKDFKDFRQALTQYTVQRTGQHPKDVIYVFVDKDLNIHTHQDTPDFDGALQETMLFVGGVAFTKTLVGSKLVDRLTPMGVGDGLSDQQNAAILSAAAKSWLSVPEGAAAGSVPCVIRWSEDCKPGIHVVNGI